jgi:hypothetical protein
MERDAISFLAVHSSIRLFVVRRDLNNEMGERNRIRQSRTCECALCSRTADEAEVKADGYVIGMLYSNEQSVKMAG